MTNSHTQTAVGPAAVQQHQTPQHVELPDRIIRRVGCLHPWKSRSEGVAGPPAAVGKCHVTWEMPQRLSFSLNKEKEKFGHIQWGTRGKHSGLSLYLSLLGTRTKAISRHVGSCRKRDKQLRFLNALFERMRRSNSHPHQKRTWVRYRSALSAVLCLVLKLVERWSRQPYHQPQHMGSTLGVLESRRVTISELANPVRSHYPFSAVINPPLPIPLLSSSKQKQEASKTTDHILWQPNSGISQALASVLLSAHTL